MGRPLFNKFLTEAEAGGVDRPRGLHWQSEFASWDTLLAQGRERARLVQSQRGYLVDPTRGLESFASFFAVATVPDTFLLWANATSDFGALRELAPGLYEIEDMIREPIDRPLWGILTSGSSGTPKVPVGYADTLELVALHYEAAVFRRTFGDASRSVETHATCLPLQFSASFFMTVLPAIFFRRDLLVFPPHDWRLLCAVAQRQRTVCLSVPSVTAAGTFSITEAVDMSNAALLLGAGYITHERVRTIRARFQDVVLMNIYGTAETGAISIDPDPGHCAHVGYPIPGKPVWLQNRNAEGVGLVATTGPDCRMFYWSAGGAFDPVSPVVASTDYGHFDDAGYLCLDGRVDEGEKLNGIIIYPRVIERHILQLDGVVDVRVRVSNGYGVGEQLTARVIGRVEEEAVREHCRMLDESQWPTRIECLSERDAERAYTTHGKL
jgi:acyl-coenzyme A synthetase/AMP-(fatty) acid ligase